MCGGLHCLDPLSSAVYGCLLIRKSCQLALVISSRLSTRILTNQPTVDSGESVESGVEIPVSRLSVDRNLACVECRRETERIISCIHRSSKSEVRCRHTLQLREYRKWNNVYRSGCLTPAHELRDLNTIPRRHRSRGVAHSTVRLTERDEVIESLQRGEGIQLSP